MRKYVLTFAMVLFAITVNAQVGISKTASNANSKWVYGGNAGLGFINSDGFSIYATPTIGYKIDANLVGGINGNFSWRTSDYSKSTIWGIGPFLNYYVGKSFYASANFQQYFIRQKIKDTGYKTSINESALNIGGGYLQVLSANAYLKIGANYNVLYKKNKSVLGSPFVPYVGVVFGL